MQAKEEMRLVKRVGNFVFCSLGIFFPDMAVMLNGHHVILGLSKGLPQLKAFRQAQRDNLILKTI